MADAAPPPAANVDLAPASAPIKPSEDHAAAAAMSSLDNEHTSGGTEAATKKSKLDQAALGDAMKQLELQANGNEPEKTERKRTAIQLAAARRMEEQMAEEKRIKAVRVDAGDVAMLVCSQHGSTIKNCP